MQQVPCKKKKRMMWTQHNASKQEGNFVFEPLKTVGKITFSDKTGRLKITKDMKVAILAVNSEKDMEVVLMQFGLK